MSFGPSNSDRADWAQEALDTFVQQTRMQNEEPETQITDLISDLFHLCDRYGIKVEEVIAGAKWHHEEEKQT